MATPLLLTSARRLSKTFLIALVLIIASVLLSACGGSDEVAEQSTPTQHPEPTIVDNPTVTAITDTSTATAVPPSATAAPPTAVPPTATLIPEPTATPEPISIGALTEFADISGAIMHKAVFDGETIWTIDRDGTNLTRISLDGEKLGSTFKPQSMFDLEVDSEFAYVADPLAGKIVQYDKTGEEVSRRKLLLEISLATNHIELDGSDLWVLAGTKLKRLSFDGADDLELPMRPNKTASWLIEDGTIWIVNDDLMSVTGYTTDGAEVASIVSETEIHDISWANGSLWVHSLVSVASYGTTGELKSSFEIGAFAESLTDTAVTRSVYVTPTSIIAMVRKDLDQGAADVSLYQYPLDGGPPTTLTSSIRSGHVFGSGDKWFYVTVRGSTIYSIDLEGGTVLP